MTSLLNPLTVALRGSHLIEASAGTGKTYALVCLYVRLILGHGETCRAHLAAEQILVLTFTRAATHELRERIRERLVELRHYLQEITGAADDAARQAIIDRTDDDFMRGLLNEMASYDSALEHCTKAAAEMDKAAIHTIHSFCQKALQRFAFATGYPFDQTLDTDTAELKTNVANDYWRRFIQPASRWLYLELAAIKIKPSAHAVPLLEPGLLGKAFQHFDIETSADPQQRPFPHEVADHTDVTSRLVETRDKVRATLTEQWAPFNQWLRTQLTQKKLKAGSYKDAPFNALQAFVEGGHVETDKLCKFTPSHNGGFMWAKGKTQPLPESLTAPQRLGEFLDEYKDAPDFPIKTLLQHAADWMAAEMDKRLEQQGTITFDTMVTHLADALINDQHGALADLLAGTYPAALIDEFQDTDAGQYAIFNAIYRHRDPATYAWLMIGDPKQSIYGFRGADIETYVAAKKAVDEVHTLTTNFRSTTAIVAAANHLFLSSPLNPANRHDVEADPGIFGNTAIGYDPIAASGRDDIFTVDGQPASAVRLCYTDPVDTAVLGKEKATEDLAKQFAVRIMELLGQARNDHAGFTNGGRYTRLKPGDIACLVRNKNEAATLKVALQGHGVDSVFLSDKSNVYDSPTATDLFHILRALISPQEGRRVRAALGSDFLAWDSASLAAQIEDDEQWLRHLQVFRDLHDTWMRFGILPALHKLVHSLDVAARQRDERALTDYFHLAELLQQASAGLDGMEAVLDYLETAMADDNVGDNGEIQLRLENEHNRVRIMTIHMAKGLQFPLVMLPFTGVVQTPDRRDAPDEAMRLLYVAITRAIHACWIGLTPCRAGSGREHQLETTALGRLLFGERHLDLPAIDNTLDLLCDDTQYLRLDRNRQASGDTLQQDAHVPTPRLPALPAIRRPEPWGVTSYSRITRRASHAWFSAASERLLESDGHDAAIDASAARTIHDFQRGPEAGNLLHSLLEKAGNRGFSRCDTTLLTDIVQAGCRETHWQDDAPVLTDWLERLITTPLPLGGEPVAFTQFKATLAESEFWLRLDKTRLDDLEQLAHELLPGARDTLPHQQLNGMLKGFIDLLFCAEGRYYVLDYKSNYLGPDASAYTQENMRGAMLAHRYELQGMIYQLALHRLLRARLPDYDPAQHLGGSLFYFLRGIDSAERGLYHLNATPELIERIDALFDGRNTEKAT